MSEPVLEQDVRTDEQAAETSVDRDAATGAYVRPVVASFSLDPHGIESGDALTANG